MSPVHGAALCTHPSQPGSAASPKVWISSVFIQFRDESSCQDPAVGPLELRARNELQTFLQTSFGTRSLKRWSYPEFTEKFSISPALYFIMFPHEDLPPLLLHHSRTRHTWVTIAQKLTRFSCLLDLCPSKYIPQKDGLPLLNLEGDVFSSPGMDSDSGFIACSVYLLWLIGAEQLSSNITNYPQDVMQLKSH